MGLLAIISGMQLMNPQRASMARSDHHSEAAFDPTGRYLGLRIVAVHEQQKALDVAPWFADGGNWNFLECEAEKDSNVRVLIGNTIRASAKTDVPPSWGEARIAVADAAAGGRFVETFAKAFHQPRRLRGWRKN